MSNVARHLASLADGDTLFAGNAEQELARLRTELAPLAARYDVVVANPPYMGGKNMNRWLGAWVKKNYPDVKGDLFSCFIVRNAGLGADHAQLGFMTPYVWMFIGTYEKLRRFVIEQCTITSLIQLEYSGFAGATVPICTFTLQKGCEEGYRGGYIRLSDFVGADNQAPRVLEALADPGCGWFYRRDASAFEAIPGSPVAYWISESLAHAFSSGHDLSMKIDAMASGHKTANNELYIRFWYEVDSSQERWVMVSKGGEYRKWYGNLLNVLDWSPEAKAYYANNRTSNLMKRSLWFAEGITWTDISSGRFHCREIAESMTCETAGPAVHIANPTDRNYIMGLLNSSFANLVFAFLSPTLHFKFVDVLRIPLIYSSELSYSVVLLTDKCLQYSKEDWDRSELSKEFKCHPIVR